MSRSDNRDLWCEEDMIDGKDDSNWRSRCLRSCRLRRRHETTNEDSVKEFEVAGTLHDSQPILDAARLHVTDL